MFPTFDVPPQHAETVGARKHRKAKEEETARRSSTATSQSSESNQSVKAESSASSNKKGGFGWFGKSKGVQEIPKVPSLKNKISEPSPPPPAPAPAPVAAPPPQETPSPVVGSPTSELAPQVVDRRPSSRSNPDLQYQHQQRFHVPPPLKVPPPLQSLSPPPTSALPQLPSPSLSPRGTCMNPLSFPYLAICKRYDQQVDCAATFNAQRLCFFPGDWEKDQRRCQSDCRESKTLLYLS